MKRNITLYVVIALGCGCLQSTRPSAEIQFQDPSGTISNDDLLNIERNVLYSHAFLGETIDSLDFAEKWGVNKMTAVDRLRNALSVTLNQTQSTIIISLKHLGDEDRASIIQAICHQIPKEQEVGYDPTPPTYSFEFSPKDNPNGRPKSENAKICTVNATVIRNAK